MKKEVVLKVNGREIPLNRFASEVLISTVKGLIQPLRGVENPQNIEIHIQNQETTNNE